MLEFNKKEKLFNLKGIAVSNEIKRFYSFTFDSESGPLTVIIYIFFLI